MNDTNSKGEISFVKFHPVNIKGNWTHLAEKNSRLRAKINAIFRLHENILIVLS